MRYIINPVLNKKVLNDKDINVNNNNKLSDKNKKVEIINSKEEIELKNQERLKSLSYDDKANKDVNQNKSAKTMFEEARTIENNQEKMKKLNNSNSKTRININIINDYDGSYRSANHNKDLLSDTDNSLQLDSDKKSRSISKSNSKKKLDS